ncbi:phosphatase PAP2 family protein [Halorussus halophilus]|uniref:phosphatase PAP2 family protein n=1 Tax=Halorussus halophilus TaxID=2650975 RepID=UPI001300DE1D|nr:phosphatase PAP2 family protein [Halorussus halophilus]
MGGRGLGIVDALEALVPQVVRELFTVVTQLGDAWFLFVAVALLYWFVDRRRGAFALAALLGALSLTLALKGLFALPRPPVSLQVGHATGHGFPSGHAIGSTVVWVLLAWILDHHTRSRRAIVAAAVVTLVASSRVIIGVHYVVDVLVGVAVGLAYLGLLVKATDWNPTRAFGVAFAVVLAAIATNGLTTDTVASLAGVLGASAVWVGYGDVPRTSVGTAQAAVGLAVLGAVGVVGNRFGLPLPAVFVLNAVIPAGILALPLVVGRVEKEPASETA